MNASSSGAGSEADDSNPGPGLTLDQRIVEELLDMARWAPSGDNTQPWRFEILGQRHWVVHGSDSRDDGVYDLDGHSSQMALGALLETLAVGASRYGLTVSWERRCGAAAGALAFDVRSHVSGCAVDPLAAFIRQRSVHRRALGTRALTAQEKQRLESSVGADHRVVWLEGLSMKARVAALMFRGAGLRLSMPEAYRVHRKVIQWRARFSEDRIPDQALGLDPVTLSVMRLVMHSWGRVDFCNRFLAADWLPRIEMEVIPSLACAAHFLIVANEPPSTTGQYVDAGRGMQRFWLTATMLGLQLQPQMTPLIFARYVRDGIRFSEAPGMAAKAQGLRRRWVDLVGEAAAERVVFMGRLGEGPPASARSTRRPLKDLMRTHHGGD